MGQKTIRWVSSAPVTATGPRAGTSNQNFAGMLARPGFELPEGLKSAAVSRILIERPPKNARITITWRVGRGDRQEGRGHRGT